VDQAIAVNIYNVLAAPSFAAGDFSKGTEEQLRAAPIPVLLC
jgi:hypothetical protein